MKKRRSRKGNYKHEKWLIQQRILGVLLFVLSVLACTIEMDFTPCLFTFCVMIAVFMPEDIPEERGDKS